MGQQIIIPNRGTVTQNLPVPTDLIAWYRFEEAENFSIALDWAMNFNTAVNDERSAEGLFGQGLPTYEAGKDNFKGLILLNEIPSSQEITVEFWVKLAKELTMGEHRTYTLFSKKWVSGMQWYAYFVTRLETVQLHCCFSYLVADAENPSIQVKGATWSSLLANGVYYKKSAILYEHAEYSDWRLFYDSDDSKWKIQNSTVVDDETVWTTHFESASVAGEYTTTAYGKGTVVATGVEEVSDIAVISLPYAKADEWTRVVLPLKLRESLPSSFGIYYGDYSSVRSTTQIVDIPVNTDIDPQLIGEQSQLMLCTNDPSIPYIIDGHPLPTSARYGIQGIIDEVKVWRSLVKTVPIVSVPTLTVNSEGLGDVTVTPDKAEYDWNEEVILEAVPDPGMDFEGWQGDVPEGEETTNPLTIYMDGSKDITAVFSGKCATPQFSPDGGNYGEEKEVTISCATSGATIYYTTDGSDPDDGDTEYTGPVTVDKSMVLKAIAYKAGYDPSDVKTGTYTLTVLTPVFDP
nr:chitobiase/beta-hexosaminidase C-terminal domain-containing protein [Dehalococcoidales bacterium]